MPALAQPILVGIDDSPGADHALRWAVEEAAVHGRPLRLVYAFPRSFTSFPDYWEVGDVDRQASQDAADRVIVRAVDTVQVLDPELDVAGDAVEGDPVQVLLDASGRASELVLGSRHHKAFGSAVLGSVSAAVSARAACPAIVVRGSYGTPAAGSAVVVGVDATEASDTVLGFAFDYASWHGVAVRPMLCWHPNVLAPMGWRAESPAPARAEAWLHEALAGWQEKYPDVVVQPEVIREYPTSGLVIASTRQRLLVVGSHGRHALSGTLLGSVSQGVLHHARCPVAVVPTHR
jgi:nucleotide-binding universal stress UspA family protein